ncbi:helix-turn-helix domain-containing protein [Granulicella tundricola]|uniref:helix-turn-helix domain-containing protein n=1 Tax=Granulicella tundricola TaxID=940615 RepID=UPI0005A213E8
MTLERVCEETRVSLRFLEAVEAEEYATLPGGVFRKGIVRAYLKSVGLDEPDWMPRFQSSLEAYAARTGRPLENDGEAWVEFAENVKRNRTPGANANSWRWVGVAIMLLVLAVIAWALWHYELESRLSVQPQVIRPGRQDVGSRTEGNPEGAYRASASPSGADRNPLLCGGLCRTVSLPAGGRHGGQGLDSGG